MADVGSLLKVNLRVNSMAEARSVFETVLGAELVADRGGDTIGDFDGAVFRVGETLLDIMAPNDPEGRLANNIRERGEGLDSICFDVPDFDAVEARLAAQGIKMINVREFHGRKVGFVHPRDCCGVLVEFIQQPAD